MPVHCVLLGGGVLAVGSLAEHEELALLSLGVLIALVPLEARDELEPQRTVAALKVNMSLKAKRMITVLNKTFVAKTTPSSC